MNIVKKLVLEINKLEQQFMLDIARVAAELEPLPNARDTLSLELAWTKAVSSQRILATSLKDGLQQMKTGYESGGVSRHRLRAAQKHFEDIQSRLHGWKDCRSIISTQLSPELGELASTQESLIMDHIVNLFFDSMHKIANPSAEDQDTGARDHGCHRDIPYSMSAFSSMIGTAHRVCLALQKRRPLRFLDVGCGGGTKVLAATTCFDLCDGLEYEENVVVTGQQFLGMLSPGRCRLMQGDALEFSHYGEYDVIFFYKPLVDDEKMAEMEERIFNQSKPGTVLLSPLGLFADDPRSKNVHELVRHIYITGKSEDEASEIIKTAGHIGPMVPGVEPAKLSNPQYWTQLLENSAKNGYYL